MATKKDERLTFTPAFPGQEPTWYCGENAGNLGTAVVYTRMGYRGGPLDVANIRGPYASPQTKKITRLITAAPRLLEAVMDDHAHDDPAHREAMPTCWKCRILDYIAGRYPEATVLEPHTPQTHA